MLGQVLFSGKCVLEMLKRWFRCYLTALLTYRPSATSASQVVSQAVSDSASQSVSQSVLEERSIQSAGKLTSPTSSRAPEAHEDVGQRMMVRAQLVAVQHSGEH